MLRYRDRKLYKVHKKTVWPFGEKKTNQWDIFKNSTYFDMDNPDDQNIVVAPQPPQPIQLNKNNMKKVPEGPLPPRAPAAREHDQRRSDEFERLIVQPNGALREQLDALVPRFRGLSASTLLGEMAANSFPSVGAVTGSAIAAFVEKWAKDSGRQNKTLVADLRRSESALELEIKMLVDVQKADEFRDAKSKTENDTLLQIARLFLSIVRGLLLSERAKKMETRGGRARKRKRAAGATRTTRRARFKMRRGKTARRRKTF